MVNKLFEIGYFIKSVKTKLSIQGNLFNREYTKSIIREELQKIVLYIIYNNNYNIYFMWGTNLRFAYNLDRYSEDLDFSTLKNDINLNIHKLNDYLKKEFNDLGFDVTTLVKEKWNVKKIEIKFSKILHLLEDIFVENEKIMIKVEIDINPPLSANDDNFIIDTLVWKAVVKHFDLPTTFAGKTAAFILRKYIKWRDFYDMYWYYDKIIPYQSKVNLDYLNNNIIQQNNLNNTNIPTFLSTAELSAYLIDYISSLESKQMIMVEEDLKRFVNWDEIVLKSFIANYKSSLIEKIRLYEKKLTIS